MIALWRFAPLVVCLAPLFAQTKEYWQSCPIIAKLPASMRASNSLDDSERFEIRQCEGGQVYVTALERGAAQPSLIFAGDGYPRFLAHAFNVLVVQSMGGASDHVYVFAFRSGKPELALKTATKDLIQVRQDGGSLVVLVPLTTYPGPDGKFPPPPPVKRYSFALEP
ncbi:MAG: hypothetical protein ABI972_16050 [Acidobacteriota bacterium]